MVETTLSHTQSTCGSTLSPHGKLRHGKRVELCDTHIETRGPKVIRIKWGVPWGEVPTFHGAASQTPNRGIPGGGIPWVLPLAPHLPPTLRQRIHRPGKKPSGVSAFVGVNGEGHPIERSGSSVLRRTRRRRRLQSAGRPRHARQGQDLIQFLSATLSHTQSIFSPRHVEYSVHVQFHVRGSTCPWTSWDPVAFNVEGGN
jgi:hypothetical protein